MPWLFEVHRLPIVLFIWVCCSYVLPFKIISSFLTHRFQTKLMVFYNACHWKHNVLIEAPTVKAFQ